MRDLLRRRQQEQLAGRSATGDQTGLPRTTFGRLGELRRELNALVAATHHRTGRPHGAIHSELRRICGGPPVAAADAEQLQVRIAAVRGLNSQAPTRGLGYLSCHGLRTTFPIRAAGWRSSPDPTPVSATTPHARSPSTVPR
jgi:hypothetical protein